MTRCFGTGMTVIPHHQNNEGKGYRNEGDGEQELRCKKFTAAFHLLITFVSFKITEKMRNQDMEK